MRNFPQIGCLNSPIAATRELQLREVGHMIDKKLTSILALVGCIVTGIVALAGEARSDTSGSMNDSLCNYCDGYEPAMNKSSEVHTSYVPGSGYSTISK